MGQVIEELQTVLEDKKKKKSFGLFDASTVRKKKALQQQTKACTQTKADRSQIKPDSKGFSGRHLKTRFFERHQTKRERTDSTDDEGVDGGEHTAGLPTADECTKRSKQMIEK
jgi:hypothetical protein